MISRIFLGNRRWFDIYFDSGWWYFSDLFPGMLAGDNGALSWVGNSYSAPLFYQTESFGYGDGYGATFGINNCENLSAP